MSTQTKTNILKLNPSIIPSTVGQDENTIAKTLKKYAVHIIVASIVVIIIIALSYYLKEHYITESVRSDSDASLNGWDLRESINKYLKAQQNLLSGRVNRI